MQHCLLQDNGTDKLIPMPTDKRTAINRPGDVRYGVTTLMIKRVHR